jgi:serine/threonine protein kinase
MRAMDSEKSVPSGSSASGRWVSGKYSAWPLLTYWNNPSHEVVPTDLFHPGDESVGHPLPPYTSVALGHNLGNSANTTLHELYGPDGQVMIIQYDAHCIGEDGEFADPVLRESHYLELINTEYPELTHKLLYTSYASLAPPGSKRFSKLVRSLPVCSDGFPARIRFLVVENVSSTLQRLLVRNGPYSLPHIAAIGLQMVRLVRKLHTMGIAHGNLQLLNVVVSNREPRELMLTDFESARKPRTDITQDESLGVSCHPYNSMWESVHWGKSYRDDIFRVVLMMAFLAHGIEYQKILAIVCNREAHSSDIDHYVEIKSTLNFFDTVIRVRQSNGSHRAYPFLLSQVEPEFIAECCTRFLLEKLLRVVRAPATPNDKPDYDEIERILILIRQAAPGEDPAFVQFQ